MSPFNGRFLSYWGEGGNITGVILLHVQQWPPLQTLTIVAVKGGEVTLNLLLQSLCTLLPKV